MVYTADYMAHFREADSDGMVSLRGYMSFFQDMVGAHLYVLKKGTDVMKQQSNSAWMYTKCRLKLYSKVEYAKLLHLETWMDAKSPLGVLHHCLDIRLGDRLLCQGRLENCLVNFDSNRLSKPSSVGLPGETGEDRDTGAGSFSRLSRDTAGMEMVYVHRVRYTDLDNNGHMNNLKYVDVFLNAFDSGFHAGHFITDWELNFLRQSYEGDDLNVYRLSSGNEHRLVAQDPEGNPVAVCRFIAEEA